VEPAGCSSFFDGDTHALIPLYMIGVFLSFTLSQTGCFFAGGGCDARAGERALPINGLAPR
jgi:hypothetical protein